MKRGANALIVSECDTHVYRSPISSVPIIRPPGPISTLQSRSYPLRSHGTAAKRRWISIVFIDDRSIPHT